MLGYRTKSYVTPWCNFFLGAGNDCCFGGSCCCHHHHFCCCHCFILGQMYCVSGSLLCYHVGHYLIILIYKNVFNLSALFYITVCCCPLILALKPEAKLKFFMSTLSTTFIRIVCICLIQGEQLKPNPDKWQAMTLHFLL